MFLWAKNTSFLHVLWQPCFHWWSQVTRWRTASCQHGICVDENLNYPFEPVIICARIWFWLCWRPLYVSAVTGVIQSYSSASWAAVDAAAALTWLVGLLCLDVHVSPHVCMCNWVFLWSLSFCMLTVQWKNGKIQFKLVYFHSFSLSGLLVFFFFCECCGVVLFIFPVEVFAALWLRHCSMWSFSQCNFKHNVFIFFFAKIICSKVFFYFSLASFHSSSPSSTHFFLHVLRLLLLFTHIFSAVVVRFLPDPPAGETGLSVLL